MHILLIIIRYGEYSYTAIKLLKCTSLLVFSNAFTEFSNRFIKNTNKYKLKDSNSVLERIIMIFADGSINIVDKKHWNQIFRLSKINFHMSSTTNLHESSH